MPRPWPLMVRQISAIGLPFVAFASSKAETSLSTECPSSTTTTCHLQSSQTSKRQLCSGEGQGRSGQLPVISLSEVRLRPQEMWATRSACRLRARKNSARRGTNCGGRGSRSVRRSHRLSERIKQSSSCPQAQSKTPISLKDKKKKNLARPKPL